MDKSIKRIIGLCLLALVVGVLAWRLWPDGEQARRQQRNSDLVRAVQVNDLAAATRLLNEGADPNAQAVPLSFTQKVKWDYVQVSHGRKALTWSQMDAWNPRWSALEIAVLHGKLSMVKVLLSKGAEVRHRDEFGDTALSWAERLKGGPKLASDTHDRLLIAALLEAAEARKKARS